MKDLIRRVMHTVAPGPSASFFAARARAQSHRWLRATGHTEVVRQVVAHLGDAVLEGPFRGLRFGELAAAENIAAYVSGIYESQLDDAWTEILARDYGQVIDIGAKVGFYAVGLARRYPAAEVVAFDVDPWARRATRETARINGVTNVNVLGACSPRWLADHLRPRSLVVCDCEGYEDVLFSGPLAGAIASATLVIETHDQLVAGVSARLRARFAPTHRVAFIPGTTPGRQPTADLSFLRPDQLGLVDAARNGGDWMVLTPLA